MEKSRKLWEAMEAVTWLSWPALGSQFMAKHVTTMQGYLLFLTDGVQGWCEECDAKYVSTKSEDWTSCLEGDVQQIAGLVLQELSAVNARCKADPSNSTNGGCKSSVTVAWADGDGLDNTDTGHNNTIPSTASNGVVFSLKASLEGLPYRWMFALRHMTLAEMRAAVTVPVAVQLEYFAVTVADQRQELRRLRQRLEDLTPDDASKQNDTDDTESDSIRRLCISAQAYKKRGLANILVKNWHIGVHAAVRGDLDVASVSPAKGSHSSTVGNTGRPVRVKRHLLPHKKTSGAGESCSNELLTEADQKARRDKLLAISNGRDNSDTTAVPQMPVRKKKKLNI